MKYYALFSMLVFCNQLFSAEVFFSSRDNLEKELCQFIGREEKSIRMAVYFFTDKRVAKKLGEASLRGVDVQVVVCKTALESEWHCVSLLPPYNIRVSVYDTGDGIMHHKFFIFGCNKGKKSYVWTGSYNPTRAASMKNCENVIVENDPTIIASYEKEYKRLEKKTHSYRVVQQVRTPFKSSIVIPKMQKSNLAIHLKH